MIPTTLPPPPAPSYESESRTWAMLAHLSIFAHLFVPFGGLIASIMIYTIRKDDAIARENERNALNFEITLAVLGFVGGIVYLVGFLAFAILVATQQPAHSQDAPWPIMAVAFGSLFVVFLVSVVAAIVACFGARAAWLGRVFKYPLTIDFVR